MASFKEVRRVELEEIRKLRERRGNFDWENGEDLTGLCFSGGGIRSATFCLGVLQGLASYRLLRRFDYISSVSGGGYIAGWLISWIKRPGEEEAQRKNPGSKGIDIVEKALREAPPHFQELEDSAIDLRTCLASSSPVPAPQSLVSRFLGWIKGATSREKEFDGAAVADVSVPPVSANLVHPPKAADAIATYQEPGAINFLRSYSNYLTPRLGFFGADTWVAVATYIRNLLLNQTILLSSLAAIILLPRCVQGLFDGVLMNQGRSGWYTGGPAIVLLIFALSFIDRNIADFSLREAVADESGGKKPDTRYLAGAGHGKVLWFGVLPTFLATVLGTLSLAQFVKADPTLVDSKLRWWIGVGLASYLIARIIAQAIGWVLVLKDWKKVRKTDKEATLIEAQKGTCAAERDSWKEEFKAAARAAEKDFWEQELRTAATIWCWAPFAGALGGVLIQQLARLFREWLKHPASAAHLASWGPALLISIILLTGVLHVGLMNSEKFPNQKKEWWARLAAWLLIWTLTWVFLYDIAIFAPLGILTLTGWLETKVALIASWAAATLYGVVAGRSPATSGEKGANRPLELALRIAPYIFIVGTLVFLSYGIYRIFGNPPQTSAPAGLASQMQGSGRLELTGNAAGPLQSTMQVSISQSVPTQHPWGTQYWNPWKGKVLFWTMVGLGVFALFLAWRVDINEYSFHLFYRNRLVRCYLGASNPDRCPHPFTGFDPSDDILLRDFSPDEDKNYTGPYPILNAALNITHGQRLAWQERRAESFVFTPRFCGFDFQEERNEKRENSRLLRLLCFLCYGLCVPEKGSYQETSSYTYPPLGPYLGTAVATSGAAVNPNMGYHASPPVAFLLTLFNVRLGWWMVNPRRAIPTRPTPWLGLFYLLGELYGQTDDTSKYVNLSDGWHFENLGLYELVRRECKYILVCDVGADQGFGCEDLGNAIRKCRSDFGVEIEMDVSPLRPDKDGLSESHFVSGTIQYPNGGTGRILYVKSGLTGKEPQDILAYKVANKVFPHQGTGDQWFNESQFESYRALGRFAVESMLSRTGDPESLKSLTTAQIFQALG